MDGSRPCYLLFLTDGLPTAGEVNEQKIVANSQARNRVHARVIAFGVGYDVNSRLLDKLVRENFGQSEYVRPNENIEERVSRLYQKIESPVMTDVAIEFAIDALPSESGKAVNRVYPQQVTDLFAGEQLVLVGRYKTPGRAKVIIQGKVGQQRQSADFPAELIAESKDENYAFIEKLWAVRRVGEIIDELDLKGKNDELIKELVALSTRHGILTPYTSFLADETKSLNALTSNAAEARERLSLLEQTQPAAGDDVFAELAEAAQSVRNIGNKAFYRRGRRWVDAAVTDEQERQARRVAQFSDEYFRLAKRHGHQFSQYLVFDEPLLVELDGEAYLVEPAD